MVTPEWLAGRRQALEQEVKKGQEFLQSLAKQQEAGVATLSRIEGAISLIDEMLMLHSREGDVLDQAEAVVREA